MLDTARAMNRAAEALRIAEDEHALRDKTPGRLVMMPTPRSNHADLLIVAQVVATFLDAAEGYQLPDLAALARMYLTYLRAGITPPPGDGSAPPDDAA